eukprot:TRINITY_DN324_c2_g1_i1.p1 TRINITY_DN324_c2_g1~~TRINITY_DN324_c2_g1_i1.p1  ORF type:complete len:262 (-),score=11.24 TRINITY_DN324_c2_g1_i1:24-809(-)
MKYLWEKVDNISLIYFRIIYGSVMLYQSASYLVNGGEKIGSHFFSSHHHFKFYGFEWIKATTFTNMYWMCVIMTILSLFVMIGFQYRASMILYLFLFNYFYMLEESYYLNHFYMMAIICFMMIFMPLSDDYSVDVILGRKRKEKISRVWYTILRFQICLVYFYATYAKFNEDWLRGEPLRHWLYNRSDRSEIGFFLNKKISAYLLSYGGILVDGFLSMYFFFYAILKWVLFCGIKKNEKKKINENIKMKKQKINKISTTNV